MSRTTRLRPLAGLLAAGLAAPAVAAPSQQFPTYTAGPQQDGSYDPDTLNHLDWYEATGYKRPYPGETKVRSPSEFQDRIDHPNFDLGD